ncbi:MAG: DNA-binding NarL/FixJ family response regulator [Alteromonadaceae bacterium]|jgi:DNA-binding NarL/FixJ family response regulator
MLTNKVRPTAFMLTNTNDTVGSIQQSKVSHFVNLIKTCGMTLTINTVLPAQFKRDSHDIFFIDLYHSEPSNPISEQILQLAAQGRVALFNCQQNFICEKKALLAGVHAIFYCDDRADIILKGIEYLTRNGRWFKRKTMNLALAELLNKTPKTVAAGNNLVSNNNTLFPNLTKREKTIINLVSSGAQNKEIAERLHISPNTVKTHIYSIFRKTSSRNRVELISWTTQFNH